MEQKTILMVDDEADFLRVLNKRLTLEGFEVITTDKGLETLALAKKHHPDLVMLDINMPDVNGGEIACQLRDDASTKHIPVLFLSALISSAESNRMKHNCGGNPILSKSTKISDLVSVINEMIYHPMEMS